MSVAQDAIDGVNHRISSMAAVVDQLGPPIRQADGRGGAPRKRVDPGRQRQMEKAWTQSFEQFASSHVSTDADHEGNNTKIYVHGPRSNMVEFAEFPGFHPNILCSLPGHQGKCDPEIYVLRAIKSRNIVQGKPYQEHILKYLHSTQALNILCDSFWWIWLEQFGKLRISIGNISSFQANLFNRVAQNYVSLFESVDARHRDHLFGMDVYPDILAQEVYSAFATIFCDSKSKLTARFKGFVCDTLFQWTTGILPMPRMWIKWQTDVLEEDIPSNMDKVGHGDRSASHFPVITSSEQSTPASFEVQTSFDDTRSIEVLFDLRGYTPLFTRFLELHGLNEPNHKSIMISRIQLEHGDANKLADK